jgi:hypothetical protein
MLDILRPLFMVFQLFREHDHDAMNALVVLAAIELVLRSNTNKNDDDDDEDDSNYLYKLILDPANRRMIRACTKRKRIASGSDIDPDSDLDLLDDSGSSDDDADSSDAADSSDDESSLGRPLKRTRRQLGQELMQEDQDQNKDNKNGADMSDLTSNSSDDDASF